MGVADPAREGRGLAQIAQPDCMMTEGAVVTGPCRVSGLDVMRHPGRDGRERWEIMVWGYR